MTQCFRPDPRLVSSTSYSTLPALHNLLVITCHFCKTPKSPLPTSALILVRHGRGVCTVDEVDNAVDEAVVFCSQRQVAAGPIDSLSCSPCPNINTKTQRRALKHCEFILNLPHVGPVAPLEFLVPPHLYHPFPRRAVRHNTALT